jgi:alpha-glucosidase
MLTLRGTPFLYNGEEIGMTNLLLNDVSQFRDNLGVWMYHMLVDGLGSASVDALALATSFGRDKCRTPMQWADAPNGGFSPAGVQTWLPVNPDYAQGINVADQLDDPDSLLSFYRCMLRIRKQTPALIAGDYTPLHENVEDYLAFLRGSVAGGQTCLVVLNMSERTHTLSFDLDDSTARQIFSSHARPGGAADLTRLQIAPFEIYIAELVWNDVREA